MKLAYRNEKNAKFMPEDDAGYRGLHTAPMADSGSPGHNLKDTYPDDIYSSKAAQYADAYAQMLREWGRTL